MTPLNEDAIIGCLLGQAVGDALGLPMEGLSRRRGGRLYPDLDRYQFFFGRGMGSDDTEHACMTAQALLRSGGDEWRFRFFLGWRLRWWLLGLPAGIGKATLKACVKLWVGWSSDNSGVYSAGNGPAMRAAVIGVAGGYHDELRDSTLLTHTHPQAYLGAIFVSALAEKASKRPAGELESDRFFSALDKVPSHLGPDSDIVTNLRAAQSHLAAGASVEEFAAAIGLGRGVTGYIAHTVPVAVFAFFHHPDDYRSAVQAVIRCGGDTDTVAAITGALVGARVGKAGIPEEWLRKLTDWPRSVAWIERLGRELAKGEWRHTPQPAVPLTWWAIPFRNFVFFLIVLFHVFRRLLPPY